MCVRGSRSLRDQNLTQSNNIAITVQINQFQIMVIFIHHFKEERTSFLLQKTRTRSDLNDYKLQKRHEVQSNLTFLV